LSGSGEFPPTSFSLMLLSLYFPPFPFETSAELNCMWIGQIPCFWVSHVPPPLPFQVDRKVYFFFLRRHHNSLRKSFSSPPTIPPPPWRPASFPFPNFFPQAMEVKGRAAACPLSRFCPMPLLLNHVFGCLPVQGSPPPGETPSGLHKLNGVREFCDLLLPS